MNDLLLFVEFFFFFSFCVLYYLLLVGKYICTRSSERSSVVHTRRFLRKVHTSKCTHVVVAILLLLLQTSDETKEKMNDSQKMYLLCVVFKLRIPMRYFCFIFRPNSCVRRANFLARQCGCLSRSLLLLLEHENQNKKVQIGVFFSF